MPPASAQLPLAPNPHGRALSSGWAQPRPKDFPGRKWQQVEVMSLFSALSFVGPPDGFHQPHGMLARGRLRTSAGKKPQQAPAPAGKGGFLTGPGQPHLGPVTLAPTIKVPFPVWTAVDVPTQTPPMPVSLLPQESQALAAQNSFMGGFASQVCVVVILGHVRPVPLALLGPGEEGPGPSWPRVLGPDPIV